MNIISLRSAGLTTKQWTAGWSTVQRLFDEHKYDEAKEEAIKHSPAMLDKVNTMIIRRENWLKNKSLIKEKNQQIESEKSSEPIQTSDTREWNEKYDDMEASWEALKKPHEPVSDGSHGMGSSSLMGDYKSPVTLSPDEYLDNMEPYAHNDVPKKPRKKYEDLIRKPRNENGYLPGDSPTERNWSR